MQPEDTSSGHNRSMAGQKIVPVSIKPDDISTADLQGEAFWKKWQLAGGDCDEYMKETLPNYGLVGTLLITITIPGIVYPPEFFMSTEYGENKRYYADLYVSSDYAKRIT